MKGKKIMEIKDKKLKAVVNVSEKECPLYTCYSPHKYRHQSVKSNTSYQDDFYSCSHRNYHGCPENPIRKEH